MTRKEKYSLMVQDLMDLIPVSSVFKREYTSKFEDIPVAYTSKWIVGEYTIDTADHEVCSIEADDVEVHAFRLKQQDYEQVVQACEQRRAALLAKYHKKR